VKPYYEDSAVQIFHGDCREIVPQLGKFDLLLTDPPYGIDYRPDYGNRRLPNGGWMQRSEGVKVHGDNKPFDPVPILKFATHSILWGANHYCVRLPDGTGSWLIWDKRCGIVPPRCQSDCEIAWSSVDVGDRIFRHLWDGMLKASERGISRVHPTQKPIELMAWCMKLIPDCQTIIDPFMGSGTTLRAAKDLGRKAVGIEIEEKYCEIAAKRMSQEVLQLTR
jgi:site-specific DNA-methyltransferase (adenine-specific)